MSRMGEDLKEIICHLNTSVKSQDSKDPVHQIGKVLNAHMDSLQWIDSHAQSVERKLQVSHCVSQYQRNLLSFILQEVSRLAELHRSDGERLQRSILD